MSGRWYILDGHTPVRCDDALAWGRWFADGVDDGVDRRRVARDEIVVDGAEYLVSTVFLGLDHNHGWRGPPLLFETMVFKGDEGGEGEDCWRYSSWDDAEAGHQAALNRLRQRPPAQP